MTTKWTAARIKTAKGQHKITCLTAYDYSTAKMVDEAGVQLVLVGDSLAMTMLGYDNTLPVTVEQMLHHTAAVVRGVKNALVVADMPFMSYQVSIEQALANAGRFIKEAGASAVKIEGGINRVPTVRALIENGIPVLGHIGLTPQSIKEFGGYKVQGKTSQDVERLVEDAKALAKSGIFALVLECMPEAVAAEITKSICVPTIGIGAGKECDGQILVVNDILGTYSNLSPKFVKRYVELGELTRKAFAEYKQDVETGRFPGPEHTY